MAIIETYDLAFLHDMALDPHRHCSQADQDAQEHAGWWLKHAEEIIILLGGKARRLGESIVGTGLLNGTLQALRYLERTAVPVTIVVDEGVAELFNASLYQEQYWPQINITAAKPELLETSSFHTEVQSVLIIDFHGMHDGLPSLHIKTESEPPIVATLQHLFRVGVRSYAHRGSERRYADFIEELFALPHAVIDGAQAQPRLFLAQEDSARYPTLAQTFGLDENALFVICFFQSVVVAKCYELWDEVMLQFCAYMAQHFPEHSIDFLVACGPDQTVPDGFKKWDMERWFQHFTGINNNARVLVHHTHSLLHLAILTKHALLTLANDTGPGHIAGALGIPTITPYLPGNIYSKQIWASTPQHIGITLEPNPFTYQQLEAAVLWEHTDIINSIPPANILKKLIARLPPHLQVQNER